MGLGSHVQWDRKLDGRLAQAMMSIHAVKAVELGEAVEYGSLRGSAVHDEIFYAAKRKCYFRRTNRAGGLEGGISNGMPLRVRCFMKPISTLRIPLMSVNMKTHTPMRAVYERSDVCVVPAGGVIGEAMMAYALAGELLEKFGADTMSECLAAFQSYKKYLKKL
jgi:chorismate synthase